MQLVAQFIPTFSFWLLKEIFQNSYCLALIVIIYRDSVKVAPWWAGSVFTSNNCHIFCSRKWMTMMQAAWVSFVDLESGWLYDTSCSHAAAVKPILSQHLTPYTSLVRIMHAWSISLDIVACMAMHAWSVTTAWNVLLCKERMFFVKNV